MDYLPPRVFSGEGREGDMVNLVFVAQPEDLQEAFKRAGWVKTDKWNPIFVWHLLRHRTNDTQVPMARFYLFGRVQDYSYALPDPVAIVSRRHHLRIWKTNCTVDGTPIWAGAATHDVAIEIAKRALINHRIDPAVDAERDFVGTDLTNTSSVSRRNICIPPIRFFRRRLRPAKPITPTAEFFSWRSSRLPPPRLTSLINRHLGSGNSRSSAVPAESFQTAPFSAG